MVEPAPREPWVYREARGYKWADFTEGNQANLRHGAYGEVLVGELAERIEAELIDAAPWLARPAFAWARRRAARDEARAELAWRRVAQEGDPLNDDGERTPASSAYSRFSGAAAKRFAACGLDLASLTSAIRALSGARHLAPEQADTLAELLAEGRAALEAGTARTAEVEAKP
jgi:hypothetical protein